MNTVPDITEEQYDRMMESRRELGAPGVRLKKHWFVDGYYRYEDGVIEPCANHVLLETEPEDDHDGAILIPDANRKMDAVGTVLAVGPGKVDKKGRLHPVDVEVGMRVAFKTERGMNIEVGGKQCKIVKDDFILGVVSRE